MPYRKEYYRKWSQTEAGKKSIAKKNAKRSKAAIRKSNASPKTKARIAKQYERLRKLISAVKCFYRCQNPSCESPNTLPSYCYDFHHTDRETKSFSVGSPPASSSIKRMASEMNKCTVLCSNCHRMETWGDLDASSFKRCSLDTNGNIIVA